MPYVLLSYYTNHISSEIIYLKKSKNSRTLFNSYKIFLTGALTNACLVNKILMILPNRIQLLPRTQRGSIRIIASTRIIDGIVVCDEFIIAFRIILYRFDIFNQLKTSIDGLFSWLCINKISNHADTHKICVTANARNTSSP